MSHMPSSQAVLKNLEEWPPKLGAKRLVRHRPSRCRGCRREVVGSRREDAFNPSFDALMVRARPAAHASAQRPPRTSYLIGLLRPQVGAIIQLPQAMVVMQPWLRGRRLSLGAAARGQYYFFDVNFGAPPPSDPHFSRLILREPPSSHPCRHANSTCMRLSGTTNGTAVAANGAGGTARMLGIAAAAAAAAAALSGRGAAAFCRFCMCSIRLSAAAREAPAGVRPLGGLSGSRAAPGGPGPARWWVWGMPGPVGPAAAADGSRIALPLAHFACRAN